MDTAPKDILALKALSSRFAVELLELTHAFERGGDVAHRMEMLREYAKTRSMLAEHAHPTTRAERTA